MANVYELLEIEPTEDMSRVKKAYHRKAIKVHPDKHPSQSEEKTEEFKALGAAYELVNDEAKLKRYYKAYQSGSLDELEQLFEHNQAENTSTNDTKPHHTETTTSVTVPKKGMVDIYIPVEVSLFGDHLNSLNRDVDNLDFTLLAQLLTQKSTESRFQVGATYNEAMEIVNLHSIRVVYVIAKVSVSITRLSDTTISEGQMFPSMMNAKQNSNYFWLFENSQINPEDIISVGSMSSGKYGMLSTSIRTRVELIDELWPKDHIVVNSMNKRLDKPAPLAIRDVNESSPEMHQENVDSKSDPIADNQPKHAMPVASNDERESELTQVRAQLALIFKKKEEFEAEAIKNVAHIKKHQKYHNAAQAASELYETMQASCDSYVSGGINLDELKEQTEEALNDDNNNVVELKTHRGWKNILANLLIAVTCLGLLAIAARSIYNGQFTLFNTNTDSGSKVNALKDSVEQIELKQR